MCNLTMSSKPVVFSEERKLIRPYAEEILGPDASDQELDNLTIEIMHAANHLAIDVPISRKPGSRGPLPDIATDIAASDAIAVCKNLGLTAGAWGENEESQSKAAELLAVIQDICKSRIDPDYRIRSPNKRHHLKRGQEVTVNRLY